MNISFGIITDYKRPAKLAHLLESIVVLDVPEYEVRIAFDGKHEGYLGKLRNQAASGARYDVLIIVDDDVYFDADFYAGLVAFGDGWDVLLPRLLNPDGSRLWDWAEYGGPNGHTIKEYGTPDNGFVVTPGGCVILKKHVFERVQWDEAMKMNTTFGEDYEFSQRLHKAGYVIQSNINSTVHHDDPRYFQTGNVVGKREAE